MPRSLIVFAYIPIGSININSSGAWVDHPWIGA
jgi:hypothetical protein